MSTDKKNKSKVLSKIIIETIIVFIVSLILSFMAMPYPDSVRASGRQKACFSNIRVLLGAIEYYNEDHKEKIKDLNEITINCLYKENYLKGELSKPTERCIYYSKGNLDENGEGIIYCDYHGDFEGKIKSKIDDDFESWINTRIKLKGLLIPLTISFVIATAFFIQAYLFLIVRAKLK
jgi:hypothetical protein